MKFPQEHTLQQIATIIDAQYIGDANFPVLGMNEIHVVTPGDIVFVDHPKYYDKALNSAATVILINKKVDCPEGKALLISEDPFSDFNKLTQYFKPFQKSKKSISDSAQIGEGTHIQPNTFIGNNVKIGSNCLIHSNVSIYDNAVIGNNVIIHSGTVLGGDAFYYKTRPEGFDKLRSGGRVVIEDDVEIGSNCTIDKGVTGDTTIKEGTKLDNLIQVGHDTVIGRKCLIASQVGIAGAVTIEDEVTVWGQVGMRSGITVEKGGILMGQAGITKSTKANKIYTGNPAMESRAKLKELALLRQLPKLLEKLK
ncbi:UDP-3-O-(3-hydroxymyristoyl)glucosamine N-acyltransferase [Salegentibacter sp. BDJ18]|jgi:UDP-3-O-[3-hydroxymyristoyl] glucosamine N-acyltransferase|uniref:UDP-3-O-(3-hydroxymyristoyl)glucosamine N-acyltransferase n=1 Tax=Salegentibacter sp. BDJ18 TaxID=2816376 RepID=UPI001AAE798D|nr:UDP-3-O-(3-hydroxymyristoyl)glucosamine N-acyltransferase [Salegentibacter sp. BDJ18]MBO2545008.1 UDP-3-O-(3-hydroxymyristoyl)glucosamine N-acyltransferase [Salegentibacter sp. BDJ18]|tara:strand:- start:133 stop:1062 length:930 start_codon:yes stop_codon:yes gene_type:complete